MKTASLTCSVATTFLLVLLGSSFTSSRARAAEPTIVTATHHKQQKKKKTTTAATELSYIKNCKLAGFDPSQLSCTTCKLLPKQHKNECEECCSSYKTLDKQSKRYKAAILIDTGSKAVEELLNEDKDVILEQKTGLHIKKVNIGGGNDMMMQMMMMQPEPSIILWFEKSPYDEDDGQLLSSSASDDTFLDSLTGQADEVMILDGLGRDDIREMLMDLLPNREKSNV
ncbi:MAG: hypothetical protein ACI8RD_014339 [Bacillariaceae sp.]|jgi:hypothetical protein